MSHCVRPGTVSGRSCARLIVVIALDVASVTLVSTHGRPQIAPEEIEVLRHAAERGDADAQYELADAYSNFLVESMEDAEAEAVRWYRLAASQGHPGAQLQLGRRHEQGWGVPTDHTEAARWYDLAASQASAAAQFSLGVMYAEGRGVTRDLVLAHMWLTLASTGSSDADGEQYAAVRDRTAGAMTRAQVAEAERLAREWKPRPYQVLRSRTVPDETR